MTRQLRWLRAAIGVAAMIGAGPIDCAYAGRGGGFSRGGFSRGGPAEAGSFASRSGDMLGKPIGRSTASTLRRTDRKK